MIFINHMPGHIASFYLTTRNYGFSDAAEIFVFCFGFAAARAYLPLCHLQAASHLAVRLISRVAQIYIAHIVLFVLIAATINWAARTFDNRSYVELVNVSSFFDYTQETLPAVLMLAYHPSLLDILPLYIVLFCFVPWFCVATRYGMTVLLGGSAVVYAVTEATGLKEWFEGWLFHPFYWQTVLALGFAVACLPSDRLARLLSSRTLLALAGLYLVFSFLVVAPWRRWETLAEVVLIPWEWIGPLAKTKLSLWRFAHAVAVIYVLGWLVKTYPSGFHHRLMAGMALLGRQSLHVFCLGALLSILGHVALAETGYSLPVQLGVLAIGVFALLGAAWFFETARRLKVAPVHYQSQPV